MSELKSIENIIIRLRKEVSEERLKNVYSSRYRDLKVSLAHAQRERERLLRLISEAKK